MAEVPNPYRQAIRDAWSSCTGATAALSESLDRAVRVFEAGAWVGGLADQAHAELTDLRNGVKTAAQIANAEFDLAWRAQPATVDDHAWQTHWRNFGPR